MEQNTKDILYNKKIDDLTSEEIQYISNVVKRKEFLSSTKTIFTLVSIVMGALGIGFGIAAGGIINILLGSTLSIFVACATRYMYLLLMHLTYPIKLKDLNLTEEEWKNLKKSGRLKELALELKKMKGTAKGELVDLEIEEEELIEKLTLIQRKIRQKRKEVEAEEKRESLLRKTTENLKDINGKEEVKSAKVNTDETNNEEITDVEIGV